ncbi:LacI family transcriptional regulator [Opitutaceae bacterium TAV5]|nr:LacI family transcriptional regulator [Opitutaceae bacterium TAV5]
MSDVAKKAGVHPSTVSLALRNHPSIPRVTCERIRALADRLGYRPNPLVSALVAERKRRRPSGYGSTLAFLTAGRAPDEWKLSPNYVVLHDAMQVHADLRGYRLERFWLEEPGMSPARLRQILISRGIRGIVVCPLFGPPRGLDFDFSGFAAVEIGHTVSSPNLHRVSINYYAVIRLAMERLRATGHRRIGLATTSQVDNRVNHLSLAAFLAERHNDPKHFVAPLTRSHWDRESLGPWLQAKRPDAIMVPLAGDHGLFGTLLRDLSVSVPRDLSLVCLDSLPGSRQSGVVQDLEAAGRAAVDLVTSHVERADFGVPRRPQMIVVDGDWQDGDSFMPRGPGSV